MSYLKAVLNDNSNEQIENLTILIKTGKKLNKNTRKYEKALKEIDKEYKKIEKIDPIKIKEIRPITKPIISKIDTNDTNNSKYTIKSVESRDNMIIIDFKTDVTKDFIKFYEKRVKNAHQDIYDIKGRFKDAYPTKLSINGVDQIVITQEKNNTLRILFEDKRNLKTIYFINGNRIVLKVLDTKKSTSKKNLAKISNSPKILNIGKNRVIVLDAGHGGKDAGAVGYHNRYEKHAVYNVTRYLETLLKHRGYKVYLTRSSDRFIKLKNRTLLANKKKADIFISIHANSVPKSKRNKIKGVETFFLSPARSARAKRVAELENKSDMRKMNYSSKSALLSILNQGKITASNKLAIDIHKNMLYEARQMYKDVEDSGVREGPFWVLVGAQMPSVLVEIGYISHPIEGKRLYSKKYQKKLALGIANGIDSYFLKNP
ncbi:MAG: N-acetylmuramoyl-L-alanine amidase family protein [Halarcobacter sp.]